MENTKFQAMVVRETQPKIFSRTVEDRLVKDLPRGDVLIQVFYSSLNYKDALSATGNKGVTRNFPHTPGIDAAGIVQASKTSQFSPGDKVIVTSYDLGMDTDGGFGQYIRVPESWVIPLPPGLSLEQSMVLGTAGFTAAMSVERLVPEITPAQGPVLVTGATGGVGSLACAILSKLGYEVAAVSGKPDDGFLSSLGVERIISRQNFIKETTPPLLKPVWAGVVDTVGGDILACAIKGTMENGRVTCCGLVASPNLPITVFPFILRGISLHGIDSQHCPMALRKKLWHHLASDWKPSLPETLIQTTGLNDLDPFIDNILKGRIKGRTLVELQS
ncbi:MAG: YhdH/YhfP family quinone oxidoreductase [Desulfobacter sp.]|nr:YhdH/YhfP family quinone oxidoreductase [Desulfobacter sp.]WDP84448.1 MAG: YhdH/YhfP family quinone oxidoreductase [Desulfobacter sp.]